MRPSAAWPRVRISRIVSTTVRMTTSVAPKLRASSRRKVESNNIAGLSTGLTIMDFRHQITTPGALAGVRVDALALVVTGEALDPALDPVLAALLADAIEHGDLKLKKGKTLYVHRPAGVRAARVVIAVAADATAKAVKAAAMQAIALVKGSGARHLGIGVAGVGGLSADHAEALIAAA